jgi:hypothetical protein
MLPERDCFPLAEINALGLSLGGKAVTASDVLWWAESKKLPIHLLLPQADINAGFRRPAIHAPDPNDTDGGLVQLSSHWGEAAFARIIDEEALAGAYVEIGDPSAKRRVSQVALDRRYRTNSGEAHSGADCPLYPINEDQGETLIHKWTVFADDLRELGVLFVADVRQERSIPIHGERQNDAAPTVAGTSAEVLSAPQDIQTEVMARERERALLCKVVTVLSRDWAKTNGSSKYIGAADVLVKTSMALLLEVWVRGLEENFLNENSLSAERFRKVLADGETLLKGKKVAKPNKTGKPAMVDAVSALTRRIYPDMAAVDIPRAVAERLRASGDTTEALESVIAAVLRDE